MNYNEFMEYLNKPIGFEKLKLYYKSNNINNFKVELYYDFIFGLLHIIRDTYPGDDVISTDQIIESHFKFCWNKNLENFKKEKIEFVFDNIDIYSYLYNMCYDLYYSYEDKERGLFILFTTFNKLFNLDDTNKTKSELDIFIELYKSFNRITIRKYNEDIDSITK